MLRQPPSRFDWKEERRLRALALDAAGWKQRLIAKALGVTEAAVSQWLSAAHEQGADALRAKPHQGATAKLTIAQLRLLPEYLSHGAEAYGFRGEVWTCARIAQVIGLEFGVSYHPAHVSRLLKQLKWTPQKPMVRAAQRDEVLIQHWRTKVWTTLKKKRKTSTEPLCLRMNPAFIFCPVSSRPMHRVGRRRFCGSFTRAIIYPR